MKHLHRAIGMMMLSFLGLYGAEILALPEGREMQVHAWADPEKILVPSESGTRTYSRQETRVRVGRSGAVPASFKEYPIEILYEGSGKEIWLGATGAVHFALGGRVHGVYGSNEVRISSDIAPPGDPNVPPVTAALRHLVANPKILDTRSPDTVVLDLRWVFDAKDLSPTGILDAGVRFTLHSVTVERDRIFIDVLNPAGRTLSLGLSRDFRTESAAIDGHPLRVLCDPRIPPEVPGWSFPREMRMSVSGGFVPVRSCFKPIPPVPAPVGSSAPGIQVVIDESGAVGWGPAHSGFVRVQNRIVGVNVSGDKRRLLLCAGPAKTIPMGPESGTSFVRLLSELQAAHEAGRLKPSAQFRIAELFPDDPLVVQAEEWIPRGVKCLGDGLEVDLYAENPGVGLRIRLSADLKVLGVAEYEP